MSGSPPQAVSGPPYILPISSFGGVPDEKTDIIVSSVLIAIFFFLAVTHMTIFRRNLARKRLFVFSAATFGFCMARIVTFSMRIATAKYPKNAGLFIAAQIFISAGVIILFIINFLYAQRIVAVIHPNFARKGSTSLAIKIYCGTLIATLAMVIVTTVQSFYTRDQDILKTGTNIRKFATIWFTIFAFSPIPVLLLAKLIPSKAAPVNLGTGSLSAKFIIVLIACILLTLNSAFRTGISFLPPRPISNPAWYHGKPAFYLLLPVIEIPVVIMFAVMRVDKRFYLPGKMEREAELEMEKNERGVVERTPSERSK